MRETFNLSGKKLYTEDPLEGIVKKVREFYPKSFAEGSLGHYSFLNDGEVVAEAWMHRTKPGWWLKIKNK